jgi:hypothetical protein
MLPSTVAMSQLFGEFLEDLPAGKEYLILGLSPSSVSLKQRWRNNGLSADFLADYLTTFFSSSENNETSAQKDSEIKSSVSYIANELLENAVKFNNEAAPYPISIQIHLYTNKIIFLITNSVHAQAVDKFQSYIKELINSDPDELYIRQLERNAEGENNNGSGLGLLTLLNDYQAKIGWKFETVQTEPEFITVTTMVQLTL